MGEEKGGGWSNIEQVTSIPSRQFDRRTGNSLQFDTVEKNSTYAPICLSNERLDDAMKTINPNLGANFTMFERAVDQQMETEL